MYHNHAFCKLPIQSHNIYIHYPIRLVNFCYVQVYTLDQETYASSFFSVILSLTHLNFFPFSWKLPLFFSSFKIVLQLRRKKQEPVCYKLLNYIKKIKIEKERKTEILYSTKLKAIHGPPFTDICHFKSIFKVHFFHLHIALNIGLCQKDLQNQQTEKQEYTRLVPAYISHV